jgi:hypothetical protein
MDVSGVTQSSSLYTSQTQSPFQQWRQQFQALGNALQSGNLSQAQSAFAQLMQNGPTAQSGQQNSTLTNDLNALSTALQSGNVSDAQKAFATLQQDMAATGRSHHRHHHAQQSASQTATNTNESNAAVQGLIGSGLDTSA